MEYTWSWEDEPDFMLPHAKHIGVYELEDDGTWGDELCIIVVRNEAYNIQSVLRAEARAQAICDAMSTEL